MSTNAPPIVVLTKTEEASMTDTATFPAEYAEFFSNAEPGKPAHQLLVADRRTRFRDGVIEGTATIRYREYAGSLGAHCAGWMTEDGPTNTPEGVFTFLCLDRLPERALIRSTLMEIGKIAECEWARRMVTALDDLDGKSVDDD
jgi:hypothetical protein